MKNKDIKFCIFDMDGTLVDSMGYWKNLSAEYLKTFDIEADVNELLEIIKPLTLFEASKFFIDRFSLNISPERAMCEMDAMMSSHYTCDVFPKDNIINYLENLKNLDIHLCVASATPKHLIKLCLDTLDLNKYFDFFISCDEVGSSKNSPKVYNLAKHIFEDKNAILIPNKDVAVFEDAHFAALTAKKEGYHTIGIYDKWHAHKLNRLKEIADEYYPNWQSAIDQLKV